MAHDHHDPDLHDHDRGLSHDLPRLVERGTMACRGVLAPFGGLGVAGLVACANQESAATTISTNDGGPSGVPPAGGGADASVTVAEGEIPEDIRNEVYATVGYEAGVGNLASTSLSRDMVFSDGYALQMATVTGSVDAGYVASLNIPV